ncbi:hypothetical protein MSAN_00015500 [Mycena sanguinolenta]|uniref:Uncharacterized protein n=1 Tax=Mycena sanguinolenta TaxID=230812 RepID=A0A8H6ZBH7_9AGAR|nr:hypothetical protein MSAN_00015500 [Mycena sanguinolenta]
MTFCHLCSPIFRDTYLDNHCTDSLKSYTIVIASMKAAILHLFQHYGASPTMDKVPEEPNNEDTSEEEYTPEPEEGKKKRKRSGKKDRERHRGEKKEGHGMKKKRKTEVVVKMEETEQQVRGPLLLPPHVKTRSGTFFETVAGGTKKVAVQVDLIEILNTDKEEEAPAPKLIEDARESRGE